MTFYPVDTQKQRFIQRVEWLTLAVATGAVFIVFFLADAWIDFSLWWVASLAPVFLDNQLNAPFLGREKEYRKTPLFRAQSDKLTGPGIKVVYYRIKAVEAQSRPAKLGLLSFLLKGYFPDHLLIVVTLDDDTHKELDVTLLADSDQQALYRLLQDECRQNFQIAS
ncbi:MAG: hypothetical protein LAT65_07720 [Saccharospirillum sp.]|nr:hypothetical protein [Saccharospirillum sp.]